MVARRHPGPGRDNGVTCTSAANCWAVGSVATHWNGARWSPVSIPHSDSKLNELTAVSCARAADCWAAGILDSSGAAGSAQLTDALRWNGGEVGAGRHAQPRRYR